jgi:CheY-specific phosphatase CheX
VQAVLAESVESVLERMFFVDAAGEAVGESPCDPVLAVRVPFEGDPCGWLILAVSLSVARSIAADFLAAEDQALSPGEVQDVVCELANMICGASLSRLESETTFRLGVPEIIPDHARPVPPGTAIRSVQLAGGSVTAFLYFQAAPCQSTSESAS